MQGEIGNAFAELVETLPLVTYVDSVDSPPRTLYVSPQIETMLGYPAREWIDDPEFLFRVLHPDDREWMRVQRRQRTEDRDTSLEFRVVAKDGSVYRVQSTRVIERDADGVPVRTLGFWFDITERARLEEELRQALKFEAMGRLAGGVAHDFNNVLLSMRFSSELALQKLERGASSEAAEAVHEILAVAERATNLTKQLLAFARRQVLSPEVLELNDVVSDTERMLERLLAGQVGLEFRRSPFPVHVRIDKGQLEQVIVNLVINARDAMPDGGAVRISVGTDGDAARLVITDTGAGMDAETIERIFDPFFTTKGADGTGLGLSTVHGIVTQSGGHVTVRSTPGIGTTFTILLPTTPPA
ncbi:MAG: PAS domain-containing protein [Actinobacteria bacterium]|nr:PAS domain-containing protein [Actinomycetota bacterium]